MKFYAKNSMINRVNIRSKLILIIYLEKIKLAMPTLAFEIRKFNEMHIMIFMAFNSA